MKTVYLKVLMKEVFMTTCPCCSHQMLRHVRHQRVYWFCRQCWQEMPLLDRVAGSWIGVDLETGDAPQMALLASALREPQLV